MQDHLTDLINEENEFWTQIFEKELEKKSIKYFSSYWWELYYSELNSFFSKKLKLFKKPKVLEVGSGSGKASILLGKNIDRTLFDISDKALDYAKKMAKKFDVNKVKFIQGDMFKSPFDDNLFHLVWNIGVIEHYSFDDAVNALSEMIRVAKHGGFVAYAIPNFSSGPILKAKILRHPLLRFLPGYRLGTENKYSEIELIRMLNKASLLSGKTIDDFEIRYFGNPLPMETPKIVLKMFGGFTERVFPSNKFLIFVIARIT